MRDHVFKLVPSKQYSFLIVIMIILSMLIVVGLPLMLWMRICGVLLLLAYGGHLLMRHALLKGSHTITGLKYAGEDCFMLQQSDQRVAAKILGDSVVTGLVMV